jgi:hypothetical protein
MGKAETKNLAPIAYHPLLLAFVKVFVSLAPPHWSRRDMVEFPMKENRNNG